MGGFLLEIIERTNWIYRHTIFGCDIPTLTRYTPEAYYSQVSACGFETLHGQFSLSDDQPLLML
jgi:hypothetical protein